MKACHISTVHPALDMRIFMKECRTLARSGCEVTLIVRHNKAETVDGVRIIPLPEAKGRVYRALWLTSKSFLLAVRQRANVYHIHDPELLPIGLLLRMIGRTLVYDVHEDVPRDILTKRWIPAPLRRAVAGLFEIFEDFASRRMSLVITATPFILSRFRRLGCKAENINNFPMLAELSLPAHDWAQRRHAVCYVGGIEEIRGIYEMVGAIGQTDARLLLAGQFSSAGSRAKAVAIPGWSRVDELGYVGRAEVARLLSESMAGLVLFHPVPNNVNSQPNKMFEYMSAGIPVIASDFPLWREIIKGNDCGICVDPLDPAAIARAIGWIIDNPEEAKRMGKNGRKAVEGKYNWESEGRRLLDIYEGLG